MPRKSSPELKVGQHVRFRHTEAEIERRGMIVREPWEDDEGVWVEIRDVDGITHLVLGDEITALLDPPSWALQS